MSSMSSALSTALSGLQVTQSGIAIVSNNVANAGSTGYSRQVQTTTPLLANGEVVGVRAQAASRSLDSLLQKQIWTEAAGGTYASTVSGYTQNLDTLFGQPGGSGSLDTVFNAFTTAVQSLTSTPNDQAAQGTVLNKAKLLTQQLNTISDGIQTQRSNAEQQLSTAVDSANQALASIKTITDQLNQQGSAASAALLDQRDAAISSLSGLMDIKVVQGEGNKISIFTSGGAMLFDGNVAKLSFDSHAPLQAESLYSDDPAKRGVGTVTLTASNGSSVDLIASKAIRSGTIGALIDLRDTAMVQAQAQTDGIAAAMSQALSDKTVPGTIPVASTTPSVGAQAIDLASLQNGDTVTLTVNDGGTARKFVLVKAASTSADVSAATGGVAGVKAVAFTDAASAAAALAGAGMPLASNFTASASGTTLTLAPSAGAAGGTAVTGLIGQHAIPAGATPATQAIDLASLQNGNTVSLTVNDGGTTRKFVLVKAESTTTDVSAATGGVAGVTAIAFTDAASLAAALTGVGKPLASNFSASSTDSVLTLGPTAAATTSGVTSLSARATTMGLSNGSATDQTVPLFVDASGAPYTGSFDGGSQLTGFASRIQLNPNVSANSSALIKYTSGVGDSDSARPTFIAKALTDAQMTLAPSTGIGGTASPFTGSVGQIVRQVINQQATNAAQAKSVDAGQQVVVNALADRRTATSGVSIDTEMTNLIQLQNAYSANARVMSTIKDMMQLLMNM